MNLSWEFCAPNFYDFEAASGGGGSPGADAWFDSSETKGLSTPIGLIGKPQTNKVGGVGTTKKKYFSRS